MKMYTAGNFVVAIEETKKLLAMSPSPQGEVHGLLALLEYWETQGVALLDMTAVSNVMIMVGFKVPEDTDNASPSAQLPFPPATLPEPTIEPATAAKTEPTTDPDPDPAVG